MNSVNLRCHPETQGPGSIGTTILTPVYPGYRPTQLTTSIVSDSNHPLHLQYSQMDRSWCPVELRKFLLFFLHDGHRKSSVKDCEYLVELTVKSTRSPTNSCHNTKNYDLCNLVKQPKVPVYIMLRRRYDLLNVGTVLITLGETPFLGFNNPSLFISFY